MSLLRWRKLGRIFDPAEHRLVVGGAGFAQSPQALVFDEFVRIYFSTRARDSVGKYLSQVAYVDFADDLRTVLRVSDHEVLPVAGLGCFDEHGVFPFHVVRHGERILAYPTGWSRRVSVSVETGIGLAVSEDQGRTFRRLGPGPVLGASLREPCLVGDGFVRCIEGVFHMWYIFGTGWKRYDAQAAPDRTYKIGHATSADGVNWTKDEEGGQIVPDRLGPDESQALPTVTTLANRHHLIFCYRQSSDFRTNAARGYRLGHAWSDDLKVWTREDASVPEVTSGEWDSDMQCYPHVFAFRGRTYLLYNGNEFGRGGFGLAVLEDKVDPLPALVEGRADATRIAAHLRRCDHAFLPPLSARVDLDTYAAKLAAKAERLEAWDHGRLAGLSAYYVDIQARSIFLSNLSVDPAWHRRGLAQALLDATVKQGKERALSSVVLEVSQDNHAAKALYAKRGFEVRSIASGVATMHLELS